jgi:hypothetical protein
LLRAEAKVIGGKKKMNDFFTGWNDGVVFDDELV